MKAAEFIFQNQISDKNLKRTDASLRAVELFEKGRGLGEVFFDLTVWSDKTLNFWTLDKLLSQFKNFKSFEAKKAKYLKDLDSRQDTPEGSVEAVTAATDFQSLEESFRPYKRKKKTKATLAREAGLLKFTLELKEKALKGEFFENGIESEAKKYIQPSLGFVTYETVLKGVQDILVEQGLENQSLRANLLNTALKSATVNIKAGDKFTEGGRYANLLKAPAQKCDYYLNSRNYDKFPQIKKAWEDNYLRVTLNFDTSEVVQAFEKDFVAEGQGDLAELLRKASKKALEIHALPSVTTEIFDQFYAVSEEAYLSKLKLDYMSLLTTPAFGSKPVLTLVEKDKEMASLVFVSHSGDFVSSTDIDFSKEDVVENLKSLIESITKNIDLGCVAIALGGSMRKFEKLTAKALEDLKKSETVSIVMADPRGLPQFVSSKESKFGFEDKIDNTSLIGFLLGKRVQNPLFEYGTHKPSNLLDIPSFISKGKVDEALLPVLSYMICSIGLENKNFSLGLLQNLDWFSELEDEKLEELCLKVSKAKLSEKKDLESILNTEGYQRFAKFFQCTEALNFLDRARIAPTDFSKVKDVCKEKEVSLLKKDLRESSGKIDESWAKLLGESFANYLKFEFSEPFKFNKKPYKVFSFSKSAESLDQVKEDNLYWGVVTKFSRFGAFVDIGVGVEGLIHLSELSNEFLSDARKVLRLGQWVLIKTIKVDLEGKKLSFSKTKVENRSSQSEKSRFKGKPSNKNFAAKNHKNNKGRRGDSADRKPFQDRKNTRKPKSAPFNNPFAALGELKK